MILLPMYCTEEGWFSFFFLLSGFFAGFVFCLFCCVVFWFLVFFNIMFPLERILNNTILEHTSQTKVL